MKIHLLDDRLTARPKHPEFRDRVSLRGAAKKRSSPVGVENVRKAFQAFITPARRQRVLEAFEEGEPTRIVRPETGPAKSRQLNEAIASALCLEASARAARFLARSSCKETRFRHRSGRRARSCSTSPLSPTGKRPASKPEKPGQEKSGRRKRR